jgi:hypothetical protein
MFDLVMKVLKDIIEIKSNKDEVGPKIWMTKTPYVLIVTGILTNITGYLGFTLSPPEQTAIIVVIGIIMRLITKRPTGFIPEKKV